METTQESHQSIVKAAWNKRPLIISGPAENSSDLYGKIDELIPYLAAEDFEKDEK